MSRTRTRGKAEQRRYWVHRLTHREPDPDCGFCQLEAEVIGQLRNDQETDVADLTAGQRRALDALARADANRHEARTSNRTVPTGHAIDSRAADSLVKKGLAAARLGESCEWVRITERGREVARDA